MSTSQTGRLLTISTPLGKDVLLLGGFRGEEVMSRPFEFELDLISEAEFVDSEDLIGKNVGFAVTPSTRDARLFNGFVRRFVYVGAVGSGLKRYRATIVPWLWFLTKRSNHRIFQEKSALEIIEQVFQDAGFDAFETAGVNRKLPPLEYCVQMGETDFDFVSRLLEDEGIFYYFRFEEDRHVLVLGDNPAAYVDCAKSRLIYTDSGPNMDQVSGWEHRYEFVSGRWDHTDFDFKSPTTPLLTDSDTVLPMPSAAAFERFEYPGRYVDKSHGEDKVKARMEAEECAYDVVTGTSGCPEFALGSKFTLDHELFPKDHDQEFVLIGLQHSASEGSYEGGGSSSYQNAFHCAPSKVPFRPQRVTPRPIVPGPQTAIVVGKSGDEIHTDEHGRIKVQFHWDRYGKFDEKSSCWIRVAQSTAGKKWGSQVLPRVGQEVVVEFLDGDPDRPLVTGAVYNGNNTPAYDLPANKTQSGVRSRSTTGGATNALNEIRLEDKKDSEHIFIHAQKDDHRRVVKDRFEMVGGNRHATTVGDRMAKIDGDAHTTIEGDRLEQIAGDTHITVDGNGAVLIKGGSDEEVKNDVQTKIGGNRAVAVGGSQKVEVSQQWHADAGTNANLVAGQNLAAEGGMNVHIKGGMNVVVEAGMQLTLKAGGGFVAIGPAGVDISGPMVKINSGGAAGSGAGAGAASPGAATSPQIPTAPTAPTEPLEIQAVGDGSAATAGAAPSDAKMEARWTKIEVSPPTRQAAALQSASDSGKPFCDT